MDLIIDLVKTSENPIHETDERVQNLLEHTAVWVDAQDANCLQTVVDINTAYGPTVFEVQHGPEYSPELSTKLVGALRARVAIFGVKKDKYAEDLANPKNPVPSSYQLGAGVSHVVEDGSGYDKSKMTGSTVACKTANPAIQVAYNLQHLNSRVSSHGFVADGSQKAHGDMDNFRIITAYSEHDAKLVFTWKGQEVQLTHSSAFQII